MSEFPKPASVQATAPAGAAPPPPPAGAAPPATGPKEPFAGMDGMDVEMGGGARGGKRSFTVMSNDHKVKPGGTYLSTAPMNAAKKAARQLFAKSSSRSKKIHFVVRETTRGSAKKTYKYVATKTKLSKPVEVKRGSVTIVLKHTYEVKADN